MNPLPPAEATRAEGGAGGVRAPVTRVLGGAVDPSIATLAGEVPIAFEYNGISHAVMLATPADLEDFAFGFSWSEGLIDGVSDLYNIEIEATVEGITLALDVSSAAFARLKQRRRTLAGRTGCGICGAESLNQILRPLPALAQRGSPVSAEALARASVQLPRWQGLQRETGATHAAAWCSLDGEIACVREDVGRHNAMDKVVGRALLDGLLPLHEHLLCVSGRLSFELVQKAAVAGAPILVGVGAPSSLAVELARDRGITLCGFAREGRMNVYSGGERIAAAS